MRASKLTLLFNFQKKKIFFRERVNAAQQGDADDGDAEVSFSTLAKREGEIFQFNFNFF